MTNGSCMELHYLFLKLFWVVDLLWVVQEDDSTSQQVKTFEGTWDSDAIASMMVATKSLGSSASCLTSFKKPLISHGSMMGTLCPCSKSLILNILVMGLKKFWSFHLFNQTLCTRFFHLHYTIGWSRIPIPATVTFVYYHKILLKWCDCSNFYPISIRPILATRKPLGFTLWCWYHEGLRPS